MAKDGEQSPPPSSAARFYTAAPPRAVSGDPGAIPTGPSKGPAFSQQAPTYAGPLSNNVGPGLSSGQASGITFEGSATIDAPRTNAVQSAGQTTTNQALPGGLHSGRSSSNPYGAVSSSSAWHGASQAAADDAQSVPSTSSSLVAFTARMVHTQRKVTNTPALGFGAIASLFSVSASEPPLPVLRRAPVRCEHCGGYANAYARVDARSGDWTCVLCGKPSNSQGEYGGAEDYRAWPELVLPAVDYLELGARGLLGGFASSAAESGASAPLLLVIDECLDEPHVQQLQTSLQAAAAVLPPMTRLGIITYGKTVSVYDLSQHGVAAADVLPGSSPPPAALLRTLMDGSGVYVAPLHVCLPIAQAVISSFRPYAGAEPEPERRRCLGPALEVALALMRGPSGEGTRDPTRRAGGPARVVVVAGGPASQGGGAVAHGEGHPNFAFEVREATQFMRRLGRDARRLNTVVDVFCAGTCPVRVPVLQPLASVSGGTLVLYDDFGPALGATVARAAARAVGSGGVLEVRASKVLNVTRVIGPAADKRAGGDGAAGGAAGGAEASFPEDRATIVPMASVEEGQGFAISLELTRDLRHAGASSEDFVFVQFAVHYTDRSGAAATRVVTQRLPTTGSAHDYLRSVDWQAAAVLAAKRTALEARETSDLAEMRATTDERLKLLAATFGQRVAREPLLRFPTELAGLAEGLFHLRRGPLLGGIIGHEDERQVLRSIFLSADMELSLRMLVPRLLQHHSEGRFEEVPAADVGLQSDTALVLDHGSDVFVWIGLELAAQQSRAMESHAACVALVGELTERRFPAPRILSFAEASSQARYVQARLTPLHKDPPYEQEVRFPALRALHPHQRDALKAKFFETNDMSFCEWARSLKVAPPEPFLPRPIS